MKYTALFFLFLLSFLVKAQSVQSMDTILAPASYENIFVKKLASDSLASSFLIFIKKEVKKHKHISHSEHVSILEGEGEMVLGDTIIKVKKGDLIFIPKNTAHSLVVTSENPMKAISIQAPLFEGKDRVYVD